MEHNDNLEALKHQEAELRKQLAAIEAQKREVLNARREKERQEALRIELQNPVTINIHSCRRNDGYMMIQYKPQRSDVNKILKPNAYSLTKFTYAKVFASEILPKLQELPFLTFDWDKEALENYKWVLNAPAWEVDVTITGELVLKAGPGEGWRKKIDEIPGTKWNYNSREYVVPSMECWRIPQALEGTENIVYQPAAQRMIFNEIERRKKLDEIAKKEDSDILFEGLNGNDLRPFQRVGVEFATVSGGRILLGDDTGIGKTWQAAGIQKVLAERTNGKRFQTICVVKAANIPNWVREMRRLLGIEPFLVKSGTPHALEYQAIVIDRVPFVLISYDTLGSKTYTKKDIDPNSTDGFYPWAQVFQAAEPDLLIMDEAHQIKNSQTHRFRAIRQLNTIPYVLPMTASPVLNRTGEMWTLLHMIAPAQFESEQRFLDRYVSHDGRSPREVEKLHELIRPIFLRRRKKDVLKDLPPINRILHFHSLSFKAEKVYDRVLQGIYTSLEHFDPKGKGGQEISVMGILARITRLKQVCAADKVTFTADLAREIADENDENRILIFSQFKGTASSIARLLGNEAVCTVERTETGFNSMSAVKRDELFESVRHRPEVKFIVTTEAAKEGHNLEFCNTVMFNDPFWTPEGHRQCEGRSYGRLSNPHPIDSYYIIADVDIEKWIMELLDKKLAVIEEAVDGVESSRDSTGSLAMELIQKVKNAMLSQKRGMRA